MPRLTASSLRVLELKEIDWSKKNPDWESVCLVAGSVVSNRQARQATKAYIKFRMGLKLTDTETRSLPEHVRIKVA